MQLPAIGSSGAGIGRFGQQPEPAHPGVDPHEAVPDRSAAGRDRRFRAFAIAVEEAMEAAAEFVQPDQEPEQAAAHRGDTVVEDAGLPRRSVPGP